MERPLLPDVAKTDRDSPSSRRAPPCGGLAVPRLAKSLSGSRGRGDRAASHSNRPRGQHDERLRTGWYYLSMCTSTVAPSEVDGSRLSERELSERRRFLTFLITAWDSPFDTSRAGRSRDKRNMSTLGVSLRFPARRPGGDDYALGRYRWRYFSKAARGGKAWAWIERESPAGPRSTSITGRRWPSLAGDLCTYLFVRGRLRGRIAVGVRRRDGVNRVASPFLLPWRRSL